MLPFSVYTKSDIIKATTKPEKPTIVSIIVQDLRVVFSSICKSDLTSQKPESLKCEHTVEPPAIAAVQHARYIGDNSLTPGIAATIPAAIVIATVADPTEILTRTAITKATTTIGRPPLDTSVPITSPSPDD